jgi:carboxypeptidase D
LGNVIDISMFAYVLGQDCGAEFKSGVTNGAKWYDVAGGMQDFNYLHSNAFEITLELSCCKYPKADDGILQKEWDNNREALLTYMEMVVIND